MPAPPSRKRAARTTQPADQPDEQQVLSKATLRAAAFLDIPNSQLAKVLGLSDATLSRMKSGDYVLQRDTKSFELAQHFLRLFRSLDAITDSDDVSSRSWMRSANADLGARPIDMIQSIKGLLEAADYVDTHRAVL